VGTETLIETSFVKERQRILQLRYAVFVEEQDVLKEIEQDKKDPPVSACLLVTQCLARSSETIKIDILYDIESDKLIATIITFFSL